MEITDEWVTLPVSDALPGALRDRSNLSRRKRQRPLRENSELSAAIARMLAALSRRIAQDDPEDLIYLQILGNVLREAWATSVAGLRERNSDSDIGRVLGTTKQTVQERWPRPEGSSA